MRVRVLRGRAADPDATRERVRGLLAAAGRGRPGVWVWTPGRHLAFGRRDARADGYEAARRIARERGFPPVERDVGGRAVAYAASTVAFASAVPSSGRGAIRERYERTGRAVRGALRSLGAAVEAGEPPRSFCPGDHSVRAGGGGKVAGLAQRVCEDAALVGGVVVVTDEATIAGVLDPVYAALGVPFDPDAVGSVAAAGGPDDPEPVCRAVEDALVDGRDRVVERIDG